MRVQTASRLVAPLAALVGLLVMAPASTPSATARDGACNNLDNEPRKCVAQRGAPDRYSAVQATRRGIAGRSAALLGSSYGGTRTTASGGVVIQVAKGGEPDPHVLAELPDRVDIRRVPLSERDLDAAQDSVVAQLEHLHFHRSFRAFSRQGTGSIIVAADRIGAKEREALRAAARPANLILRPASPIHLRQYPPHQGGLRLELPSSFCTSGFDVIDSADITLGLTAGHCGRFGDPVSIGGVPVGTVQGSAFDGGRRSYTDSAVYSVPPEHQTANVFTGAGSQPVRNAFANSAFHVGMRVCFFGYRSARQRCGRIYDRKVTYGVGGGLVITNSACMLARSRGGDSGGPVYKQAANGGVIAAGMVSAGSSFKIGRHRFRDTCFTKIANALFAWDIFILVQ